MNDAGSSSTTDGASDEQRIAELEAALASSKAKLAQASAKQPQDRKPRKTKALSRRAKAQALVDWFIVDSLKDAYAYLEDMGE